MLLFSTVLCGFRGGSRGRMQGVRTPPPWDEAFFFVFAFNLFSVRSVTSFIRGAPLLRKILDPPLGLTWKKCGCIIWQGICREIALVDMIEDKLKGEMLDLQHCQRFVKNVGIVASTGKTCFCEVHVHLFRAWGWESGIFDYISTNCI